MTRLSGLYLAILGIPALSGCNGGSSSSTLDDNYVQATPSATDTVSAMVGATRTMTVTFATSDGQAAHNLSVSGLTSLPGGWQASDDSFSCSVVSAGNGCMLGLTFAPMTDVKGTLSLSYTYVNTAGVSGNGTVSVAYAASEHDNVVGSSAPGGRVTAAQSSGSQKVTVTFDTDDGNVATGFELTSPLTSLPSGWSTSASGLTCASVSTGNACDLTLMYAPTAHTSGTLMLAYRYTDNGGALKTGSVSIPYAATVHDNIVGTVSPTGTVQAATGSSQAVTVTFTTDDGNAASALTIDSGLTTLPAGWSAAASFSCTQVSTGTSCRLPLAYAPTAAGSGTVMLGYGYADNSGAQKTGTVSIAYDAISVRLYVADEGANAMYLCPIGADGSLLTCTSAGTTTPTPTTITFNGNHAYVGDDSGSGAEFVCGVSSTDGTLSGCATAMAFSFSGAPGFATVSGNLLYIADINLFGGPQYCTIQTDGSLASCVVSNGAASNNQATGVDFVGSFAYVSTVGDQGLPGVRVCTVGNGGSLSGCTDAGTGLSSAQSVVASGTNVYVVTQTAVELCASGQTGALSGCVSYPIIQVQGQYTYFSGGLTLFNGHAYVAYSLYDPNSGNDVGKIAICNVGNDGSLSACADSGQSFSYVFGIAIH
jgi:hypothetical protein